MFRAKVGLRLQFRRIELFTDTGMPLFAYTARETATGRELRNTVEAATEQAAIAALLNPQLARRRDPREDRQARPDQGRPGGAQRLGRLHAPTRPR